jgi:hypothetical protein
MLACRRLSCPSSVLQSSRPWTSFECPLPHLNVTLLHLRFYGMPFLFSLTVAQLIFLCKVIEKFRGGKEIVHVQIVPHPSIFLIYSVTVARIAVEYCVICCLSFPKYTFMSCVTSWIALFVNFDAKVLVFLNNILSENHPSFE